MLALIGLAAAALGAQAQAAPSTTVEVQQTVHGGDIDKADAEKIMATCGTRRFESSADVEEGGHVRRAKLLLCAKPGESDAEWIATLRKAAASVDSSDRLPEDAKAKIGSELKAEIARLTAPLPQR
jgi:hypothetical protein